jgi:hypothetical protein
MTNTPEDAAAARRAYAREHGTVPAPSSDEVQERASLGEVLNDPYVAGAIVSAGTAAVGKAVGAVKDHITGSSNETAPPPADDGGDQ